MLNQAELLAIGRAKCGSWYRLAQRSGLTRATVSNLVCKRSLMTPDTALKIATAAGVDPVVALAGIEAERAERDGSATAPVWRELAARALAGAKTAVLAAVASSLAIGALTPRNASAATVESADYGQQTNIHYAYLRRFFRSLLPRWIGDLWRPLAGVA